MSRPQLLLMILLLASGCYRTHYVNLQPPGTDPRPETAPTRATMSGWQHFFLFGWVPTQRAYDVTKICGQTNMVEEIRTQQTFIEGVVEQLCSYYVNIYSPYDAEIFCAADPAKQTPPQVADGHSDPASSR